MAAIPPDEEILKIVLAKIRSAVKNANSMEEADVKLQRLLKGLRNREGKVAEIHVESVNEAIENARVSLLRNIEGRTEQRVRLIRNILKNVPQKEKRERLNELLKSGFVPPTEAELVRRKIIGVEKIDEEPYDKRRMTDRELELVGLSRDYEKILEKAMLDESGINRVALQEQKYRAPMLLARISKDIFGGAVLGENALRNLAIFIHRLNPESRKKLEGMSSADALRALLSFSLITSRKPVKTDNRFTTFKKLKEEEPETFEKLVNEMAFGPKNRRVITSDRPESWGPAYLRKVKGLPREKQARFRS